MSFWYLCPNCGPLGGVFLGCHCKENCNKRGEEPCWARSPRQEKGIVEALGWEEVRCLDNSSSTCKIVELSKHASQGEESKPLNKM
jgi:hypothetical protein